MSINNEKNHKEEWDEIVNLMANYIKNEENSQDTEFLIKTLYESNLSLADQYDYEQLKIHLINRLLNDESS